MKNYHHKEAKRIQKELDNLGPRYAEDGIVRTILRQRIEQEKKRAAQNLPNNQIEPTSRKAAHPER